MSGLGILDVLAKEGLRRLHPGELRVTIGYGTCGRAAGAVEVRAALLDQFEKAGLPITFETVGCRGLCSLEPLVEVYGATGEHRAFCRVDAQAAKALAHALLDGSWLDGLAGHDLDEDAYLFQERRVLGNCGYVDPFSLEEYVALGGYAAFAKAIFEERPEDILAKVEESGLRGRGGAGFPTGRKWRSVASRPERQRYFIVNGDEGDPGAYMDRGLLESDPHRVLEGLAIACYATGVHQAYFFIRAEYPLAVKTIRRALDDAYAAGLLGEDILGSGYSLDVSVVRGAGAFLCGESTAMVNVLEGKPCTTRPKPPHMSEEGLWGKPTCINNVETLANVALILSNGPQWFREVGTSASPGTKIFSVTGAVERGGLVEIPLGTRLGVVLEDIARAPQPKSVQIGGPSGAILPVSLSDIELSFEGLDDVGGMIGSGGFVVMDFGQCTVDAASYLVSFSERQSCRRCKACVQGLGEASRLLADVTAGRASPEHLVRLREVAERTCADTTLCGLGRTGLSPLLTSLHYFEDEYKAHLSGTCPSLMCRELISYEIIPEKCEGERCCLNTCPGNAIKGSFGKPGRIVDRLCQKCGMCAITCCYGAVRKVSPAR